MIRFATQDGTFRRGSACPAAAAASRRPGRSPRPAWPPAPGCRAGRSADRRPATRPPGPARGRSPPSSRQSARRSRPSRRPCTRGSAAAARDLAPGIVPAAVVDQDDLEACRDSRQRLEDPRRPAGARSATRCRAERRPRGRALPVDCRRAIKVIPSDQPGKDRAERAAVPAIAVPRQPSLDGRHKSLLGMAGQRLDSVGAGGGGLAACSVARLPRPRGIRGRSVRRLPAAAAEQDDGNGLEHDAQVFAHAWRRMYSRS